ncbi:MAG: protein-methionine-sulfoxide reductase catalytic subunit MsrP [Chloroflexi bacterium]|nr:protein-methionine-sulfoxide reductase catalytic subunit MsrP [Chloroflexota bacterium]
MNKILPSEITPEHVYLSRRRFLASAGILAASALVGAACRRSDPLAGLPSSDYCESAKASKSTDELGDRLTECTSVISYNNFYEFSFDKDDVAQRARDFKTSPWAIEVGGLVNRPGTYDIDGLRRKFAEEERIYRMRCVEAWSMVIPWLGFPLAKLMQEVEPTSRAKYVRFETLFDPQQMPGQKDEMLSWPYVEGLRLDEAMHDFTLLATGIYGKPLLPQNGAPIRLVVPWKYGFKNIKSIAKIDLVEEMPVSFWMTASPREYGFYANVNPNVAHPRWSQSSERRIGEAGRRDTVLFNGYADQAARLYEGLDLSKFY